MLLLRLINFLFGSYPEIESLVEHGTMLPPNMAGLTDEQVEELKLQDDWGERCVPSGGWTFNKDVIGRRNGRQPSKKMQEVLLKTVQEAKAMVSKVDWLFAWYHNPITCRVMLL